MSKVPGYANTYVIVLETPRTGIDLQHKAWLTEYFYAHTLSKMRSSCLWVFFPPKGEKKTKYGTSNPKILSVSFWKVLPHMRALEDAAFLINKAARWASIKTGWNFEILPERKKNHIENVWVLKFPNGPYFFSWLYSQVCFF